jgi:hypothetical protein
MYMCKCTTRSLGCHNYKTFLMTISLFHLDNIIMSNNDTATTTTVVDSANSSINSKNAHKTSDTSFNPYVTRAAPNYHVKVQMLHDGNDIVRRPINDEPSIDEYKAQLRRKEKRRLLEQGPSPGFLVNDVVKDYGIQWYLEAFPLPFMRKLMNKTPGVPGDGKLLAHEELMESDPDYQEEYIRELESGRLDLMIDRIGEMESHVSRLKRSLLLDNEQIQKYQSRRRR